MYYGGGRWRSPQEKGNLGASPSPLCSPGSPQEKVNLGASPSPLCSPGTLCPVCFRAHVVIVCRVVSYRILKCMYGEYPTCAKVIRYSAAAMRPFTASTAATCYSLLRPRAVRSIAIIISLCRSVCLFARIFQKNRTYKLY